MLWLLTIHLTLAASVGDEDWINVQYQQGVAAFRADADYYRSVWLDYIESLDHLDVSESKLGDIWEIKGEIIEEAYVAHHRCKVSETKLLDFIQEWRGLIPDDMQRDVVALYPSTMRVIEQDLIEKFKPVIKRLNLPLTVDDSIWDFRAPMSASDLARLNLQRRRWTLSSLKTPAALASLAILAAVSLFFRLKPAKLSAGSLWLRRFFKLSSRLSF